MIPNTEKNAEKEEMKKEIIGEIRRDERRRRLWSCVGCLFVEILIIAVPLYLVASIVAKTGVANVPVLTKWQYRPAAPTRIVTPDSRSTQAIIMEEAASAKPEPQLGLVRLRLTEAELTTMVRGAFAAAADQLPFPVSEAQLVVDTGRLELFLVSPRPERPVTVRASFRPNLVNGALKLEATEIVIGAWQLPSFAVDAIGKAIGEILGQAVTSGISSAGTIQEVKTEPGSLQIGLAPKK
ncbi:MAG: hypothetical protein PHT12_03455 [Patescibacteria group bacterium]|nr:hypothetical protein [Patescibacteria group bacterium]